MLKRIDRSPWLSKLLEKTSNLLAKQRGLPVVLGIALVIIGFVLQAANVYLESKSIQLVGVVMHNGGVLIALIGLLLANPLGK
jgi:hypothetical protein